jgi:flavin reductase
MNHIKVDHSIMEAGMSKAVVEGPIESDVVSKGYTGSVAVADYTAAMASAVTGVSIVTTNGVAGRFGITVSSVSSVSADPPLVLVCINRRSPACAAVHANNVFCINLLSTRQQELANTFAGRPSRGEAFDFEGAAWSEGLSGAPRFGGAVSTFDCVVEQTHETGSHDLFIGRVVAVGGSAADPLLYTRRAYGHACR